MSRISLIAVAASLLMAAPAAASAVYPGHQPGQISAPPGGKSKHKGGIVAGDGSIVTGSGFSVSHDGTGEYTIDVPAGFFGTTCPVIFVTPAGIESHAPIPDDYNYITCGGAGEVKMQIRIYSRTDGALEDNAFHFLMMVP